MNGWTATGFQAVGDSVTSVHDNYYLASNYTYNSFNKYLKYGPYNFVGTPRPNWVEHYPYQDGLLVSYWDTSQKDNETAVHPGQGQWLPIDANPAPAGPGSTAASGGATVQSYDSTFGLQKSDSFNLTVAVEEELHARGGRRTDVRRQAGVLDVKQMPSYGVKVPHAGVKIRVVTQQGTSMRIVVSK